MTILDRAYRPLSYAPTAMATRLWAIAAAEGRLLFRTKWGFFAVLLCALPSIASLILLLIRFGFWEIGTPNLRTETGDARTNPFSIRFYLDPIVRESYLPFLLLTTLVSCRSVARDRAAGGLELLWTRAISPWGYFVAKWCGSVLLLGTLFLVVPLALWSCAVLMAEDWTLFERTLPKMPAFAFAMAVLVLSLTFLATAFSAIAATPGFASILWLGLVVGSDRIAWVLSRLATDATWLRALHPWEAAHRIAAWICGVPRLQEYPVGIAVASLGTLVGVAFLVLLKKLRTEEALAS